MTSTTSTTAASRSNTSSTTATTSSSSHSNTSSSILKSFQLSPSSTSSSLTPPLSPKITSNFRTHLNHLLPHHALFHVRLVIHEISSVPLVHGDFAVRWKFHNVKDAPVNSDGVSVSLLRRVRRKMKGKGKQIESRPDGVERRGGDDDSDDDDGRDSSPTDTNTISSSGDDTKSISAASGHGHGHARSTSTPTSTASHVQRLSLPLPAHTPASAFSTAPGTPSSPSHAQRGATPFLPLKDHAVSWEHTVELVVRLDIDRETSILMPNELKLVVMQKTPPQPASTSLSPPSTRLGLLQLNIATYAAPHLGPVTRRYLLCESRTNATLKLTMHVKHLSSAPAGAANEPPAFVAPPLEKGLGLGLGGVVEEREWRLKMRELDLYSFGSPAVSVGARGSSSLNYATPGIPFDVNLLPLAYGPKTTETLIDAVFNPVVVVRGGGNDGGRGGGNHGRDRGGEESSPFVRYVDAEGEPDTRGSPSVALQDVSVERGDAGTDADSSGGAAAGGGGDEASVRSACRSRRSSASSQDTFASALSSFPPSVSEGGSEIRAGTGSASVLGSEGGHGALSAARSEGASGEKKEKWWKRVHLAVPLGASGVPSRPATPVQVHAA